MPRDTRDGVGDRNKPLPMNTQGVYPGQVMKEISDKQDAGEKSKPNKKGFNSGEESQFPALYKTDMKIGRKQCVFDD